MQTRDVVSDYVELTLNGEVATLQLKRPPLNILSIEMVEQINDLLLDLRAHRRLKVLVIRGDTRAFSAGIDLNDHTRDKVGRLTQIFHRIFESMRLLDLITVSAVEGVALGAGFELAIGSNLVVASESARFGVPEVKLGLFPPVACVILPRATPRRKAMEWILTGEEIPSTELMDYGLVNRVFADDEFEAGLDDFVGKLTSKSGPVLQLAKRAQTESYYSGWEEALYKAENLYLRDLMSLSDSREGLAAFLEKREPRWQDE
jgi:cyclohexa-1,5-dienecarbonyl-CoA hydratase